MKQDHSLFIVHPLTIVYLVISLIFNKFYYLFIHYLIALIHELSHCFMAKALKVKVDEIIFLPIGFYAKINNLEIYERYKQILILIAGPLSFFISMALLKLAYENNVISYYGYTAGNESNYAILFFNILPIYPLDGGRIVDLFISRFLNEFKTRVTRICISIIFLVIISSYLFSLGELILCVFLFFNILIALINLKKDYLNYLILRLKRNMYKKVRINKKLELFRFNNNYYISDGNIFCEEEIIIKILSREKISKNLENS